MLNVCCDKLVGYTNKQMRGKIKMNLKEKTKLSLSIILCKFYF